MNELRHKFVVHLDGRKEEYEHMWADGLGVWFGNKSPEHNGFEIWYPASRILKVLRQPILDCTDTIQKPDQHAVSSRQAFKPPVRIADRRVDVGSGERLLVLEQTGDELFSVGTVRGGRQTFATLERARTVFDAWLGDDGRIRQAEGQKPVTA